MPRACDGSLQPRPRFLTSFILDAVPDDAALTIAEAAAALGVKPQRIHQLLRDGRLTGPAVPPGRAPALVGRVWRDSLAAEQKRREAAKHVPSMRSHRRPDQGRKQAPPDLGQPATVETAQARSAW